MTILPCRFVGDSSVSFNTAVLASLTCSAMNVRSAGHLMVYKEDKQIHDDASGLLRYQLHKMFITYLRSLSLRNQAEAPQEQWDLLDQSLAARATQICKACTNTVLSQILCLLQMHQRLFDAVSSLAMCQLRLCLML